MSSCLETYTMEPPTSEQLVSRRPKRCVRRRRYDRVLHLDSTKSSSGFALRMPRKLKVANLDFRPVKRTSVARMDEDAPAPSWAWKLLSLGYVSGMAEDTYASSRDLSLVPVKPPRSLGEEIDPEPEIGFTLSVLEESYEDHLRSAFDGRYE
ncbi:hypothetical protein R1flu_001412 [Riccia fluitans]|uniref:Uncharacterized protein n=1 Tax=Riccia fluitans TaxID=41844 RepID=A0ABD1Y382_9MARC